MRLLTTRNAADYLRLKERKLYELVAEQAIPYTKVTGKWLFPQAELDHWLKSSLSRPAGQGPAEPISIVGGSHDPLLDWALRERRSGLATLPEGSEAGLQRSENGDIVASGLHLHSFADHEDANVRALSARASFRDAVLVNFAGSEQGFVVAPHNPLAIGCIADIAAKAARMAVRPESAGAQLLLFSQLDRAGLAFNGLAIVAPVCPTGPDIAQAIRAGRADCGIATRAVAEAVGLGFVPDRLGELRHRHAPARLFPAATAGADFLPAHRRLRRPRPRTRRL